MLDIITFVEVEANTTVEISLGAITDEEDDQVRVTNVEFFNSNFSGAVSFLEDSIIEDKTLTI